MCIRDSYDAADDIYGSLEYPDSSDSDYASRLSSYLSSQIQADNLREQGDDNVEDGDVKKLEYDKTEAGLSLIHILMRGSGMVLSGVTKSGYLFCISGDATKTTG